MPPKKKEKSALAPRPASTNRPVKTPGDARASLRRSLWSGTISFGLVNIPIQLFASVRPHTVRFHLLHEKDRVRLRQKLVCPADESEVSRQEAVKGVDIGGDRNVVISPDELQTLAPKATRTLELVNFVKVGDIDPIYFDQSFYVIPKEGSAKAYLLLFDALQQTNKAGVGKFVMRNKEYLSVIRPLQSVLCLETLHFADEIVKIQQIRGMIPDVSRRDVELKAAVQLVESLTEKFDPAAFHDDYQEALVRLVQKKARGEPIPVAALPEKEAPVIDLMAALQKSVEQAKKHRVPRAA